MVAKIERDIRANRRLVEDGRVTLTTYEKVKVKELSFKLKAFDDRPAATKNERAFSGMVKNMDSPWSGQYRDSKGGVRVLRVSVEETSNREDADFVVTERDGGALGDAAVSFDQGTMSVKPGAHAAVLGHELGHVLGLQDRYSLEKRPLYQGGPVGDYLLGPKRTDDPLFNADIMQNIAAKPSRATVYSLFNSYERLLQ